MAKAEIPFAHGELISVTGSGSNVMMWFKDYSGSIRGVKVDISDPSNPSIGKEEVLVKRKTEGQMRRKKLPPVGAQSDTAVMRP